MTRPQPRALSDKIELRKQAVPLDKRLVSGRSIQIEKVRASARVRVSPYSANPGKYVAKVYRGNVLVAQELVDRQDYSVEQVMDAYRQDVLGGVYDTQLTDVYQERKAGRGS